MKAYLRKLIKKIHYTKSKKAYLDLYRRMLSLNESLGKPVDGEKEWMAKWSKYDSNLSPLSYRIFSHYCNKEYIVPLELINLIVEPILTPKHYIYFDSDKNNFNRIVPIEKTPRTFVRNIDGRFYDGEYKPLKHELILNNLLTADCPKRIVLKPSKEESGRGVQMFRWLNGAFVNKDNHILSIAYLDEKYVRDYLIQEAVEQSDFLSFFNETSLNTIRIVTYRDIIGEIHVLSSILRIGAVGAEVDNAHAGGAFVGISKSGKLGKYVSNFLGQTSKVFNGINFEENSFILPNFDRIKEFAISVSESVLHHDLVALDIALDKNNSPTLIEYNVGGFSAWFFLFSGLPIFDNYTEEIFEKCWAEYKKIEYPLISSVYYLT